MNFQSVRSETISNPHPPQSIEDNHVYGLIKLVAKMYSVIRYHHLAKMMNDK